MSSMLMSALCWEGFLNYLGQDKIEYWEILEKKLTPEEKLKVLCHHLNYDYDMGKRPFQTLTEVIKFRNAAAHAKPMIDKHIPNVPLGLDGIPLGFDKLADKNTQWLSSCDEKNATRYYDDITESAKKLYKAAGYEGHPFATASDATWWGT